MVNRVEPAQPAGAAAAGRASRRPSIARSADEDTASASSKEGPHTFGAQLSYSRMAGQGCIQSVSFQKSKAAGLGSDDGDSKDGDSKEVSPQGVACRAQP